MLIYGQHDPRWSSHPLGWGPEDGTIGQYGCYDAVFAMVATDSGVATVDPAQIDEAFTAAKIFVADRNPDGTITFDLLPDNALDQLYPGRFQTRSVSGFDAAGIAAALPTPDTYAIGWISYGSVASHFVIFFSANASLIADPETGKVNLLSNYGGPVAIHKTVYVKVLPAPAPPQPTPTPQPVPAPLNGPPSMKSFRLPEATWRPSPNFTPDRRDSADPPIDISYNLANGGEIVVHHMDGSADSAANRFANADPNQTNGRASAHYGVRLSGARDQYVDEKDTAWHCGSYPENRRAIGIEHENPFSDAMYESSADLIAGICTRYGWNPLTCIHPHKEYSATQCPGTLDLERLRKRANEIIHPAPLPIPTPVPLGTNNLGVLQDVLIALLKLLFKIFGQTK